MGRWLERIEKGVEAIPPKPPESLSTGLRGVSEGPFPENQEARTTASEWIAWIKERCPLVTGDVAHLVTTMAMLHPRLQQRLAERYVEVWRAAADDEPQHHRRDNRGRRAANLIVTRLKRGAENV